MTATQYGEGVCNPFLRPASLAKDILTDCGVWQVFSIVCSPMPKSNGLRFNIDCIDMLKFPKSVFLSSGARKKGVANPFSILGFAM